MSRPVGEELWGTYVSMALSGVRAPETWAGLQARFMVDDDYLVERVHCRSDRKDSARFLSVFVFRAHCDRQLFDRVQTKFISDDAFWKAPLRHFKPGSDLDGAMMEFFLEKLRVQDLARARCQSIHSISQNMLKVAKRAWPILQESSKVAEKYVKLAALVQGSPGLGALWTKTFLVCIDSTYPHMGLLANESEALAGVGNRVGALPLGTGEAAKTRMVASTGRKAWLQPTASAKAVSASKGQDGPSSNTKASSKMRSSMSSAPRRKAGVKPKAAPKRRACKDKYPDTDAAGTKRRAAPKRKAAPKRTTSLKRKAALKKTSKEDLSGIPAEAVTDSKKEKARSPNTADTEAATRECETAAKKREAVPKSTAAPKHQAAPKKASKKTVVAVAPVEVPSVSAPGVQEQDLETEVAGRKEAAGEADAPAAGTCASFEEFMVLVKQQYKAPEALAAKGGATTSATAEPTADATLQDVAPQRLASVRGVKGRLNKSPGAVSEVSPPVATTPSPTKRSSGEPVTEPRAKKARTTRQAVNASAVSAQKKCQRPAPSCSPKAVAAE